uniref:Ig-like domain-containing protein n=1 Tax=Macrostomum lignano TaxID=282301 RepID=A0A1I8FP88_9PLAT
AWPHLSAVRDLITFQPLRTAATNWTECSRRVSRTAGAAARLRLPRLIQEDTELACLGGGESTLDSSWACAGQPARGGHLRTSPGQLELSDAVCSSTRAPEARPVALVANGQQQKLLLCVLNRRGASFALAWSAASPCRGRSRRAQLGRRGCRPSGSATPFVGAAGRIVLAKHALRDASVAPRAAIFPGHGAMTLVRRIRSGGSRTGARIQRWRVELQQLERQRRSQTERRLTATSRPTRKDSDASRSLEAERSLLSSNGGRPANQSEATQTQAMYYPFRPLPAS